jgi:hypothetical protein
VAVQERVAVLEGSVGELSNAMTAIHGRFDGLEARMQGLEVRMQAFGDRVDRRLASVEAAQSRQFTWLVGLMVTTLTASLTAVIAALATR